MSKAINPDRKVNLTRRGILPALVVAGELRPDPDRKAAGQILEGLAEELAETKNRGSLIWRPAGRMKAPQLACHQLVLSPSLLHESKVVAKAAMSYACGIILYSHCY